eukprot:305770-Amphidinium_carterae.1
MLATARARRCRAKRCGSAGASGASQQHARGLGTHTILSNDSLKVQTDVLPGFPAHESLAQSS